MALIYTPKYFAPEELISPDIYDICGPDALYMFDPRNLAANDKLREHFGPMIANTWHSPKLIEKYGLHRYRGLRAKNEKIGASLSAHKIGIEKSELYSATDLWPVELSADELREAIKADQKYWLKYISRMETDISWVHHDTKPHKFGGIRFFKP